MRQLLPTELKLSRVILNLGKFERFVTEIRPLFILKLYENLRKFQTNLI